MLLRRCSEQIVSAVSACQWPLSLFDKVLCKTEQNRCRDCHRSVLRWSTSPFEGSSPPGDQRRSGSSSRQCALSHVARHGQSCDQLQRGNTAEATFQPRPSSRRMLLVSSNKKIPEREATRHDSSGPGSFNEVPWQPFVWRVSGGLWTMEKRSQQFIPIDKPFTLFTITYLVPTSRGQ